MKQKGNKANIPRTGVFDGRMASHRKTDIHLSKRVSPRAEIRHSVNHKRLRYVNHNKQMLLFDLRSARRPLRPSWALSAPLGIPQIFRQH